MPPLDFDAIIFPMKLLILTLIFSLPNAWSSPQDVVYGEDSRLDFFEIKDPAHKEYTRATATKVPTIFMRKVDRKVTFRNLKLESRGICPSEKFSQQNTVGICSGFLIGPDTLMTAGHCVRNSNDCKNFRWVFDYRMDSATQEDITVDPGSVYSCKSIIAQQFDKVPGQDFAVIQLDRKVQDRTPLKISPEGTLRITTPLIVVGYPTGLPVKLAVGARVRSLEKQWFTANLDTFEGNSGSAVLNADTGAVEGILVRGENDYVMDPVKGCRVVNVCPDDGCRGEEVNYVPRKF